jgi:hypothetical protein
VTEPDGAIPPLPPLPPRQSEPVYFPVSLAKLGVMSFFTFGGYEIYWFYRQWEHEKRRTGEDIWPVARAMFSPLFYYTLLTGIEPQLDPAERAALPSLGLLAAGYFVWVSLWRLPDPYWLISSFSFVPLLPFQRAANQLNRRLAPDASLNDQYTAANLGGLVLGALFLALIVLGLLAGEAHAPP